MVCHLANGSESLTHAGQTAIVSPSPDKRFVVVVRVAEWLLHRAMCAKSSPPVHIRIRGPTMNQKGKISNNVFEMVNLYKSSTQATLCMF